MTTLLSRPASGDAGPGAPPARRHAWAWMLGFLLVVVAIGAPLAAAERQPRTVVLMGDSLSAESAGAVTEYLSFQGFDVKPATLGGSGLLDTKVDWLAHARTLITQDNPSVVVVEFIGDYGLLGAVPGVAAYTPSFYVDWAAKAQQLENILTSRGAKVFWVIGPPVASPNGEAEVTALDKIYAALHAPTPSGHPPLIDVTPALTGGSGQYTQDLPGPGGVPVQVRTPDGTHFTLYGVALFARAIADAVA